MSEIKVERAAEIIREHTGILLDADKMVELETIVQTRLLSHDLSFAEYIDLLENDRAEIVRLASDFTIQETSFYRNRDHFDALKEHILPALIKERRGSDNLRLQIVSAGCATGEEPYTLSMLLFELLPDFYEWDISLIAVDICQEAIMYAKRGEYSKYKMRNISQHYIDTYFDIVKQGRSELYRIKKHVKDVVTFRHGNLLSKPFELSDLSDVDIVLCENVIIYFDKESVSCLIKDFYNLLHEGGVLFLGYSETLSMIKQPFEVAWYDHAYYYCKQNKSNISSGCIVDMDFVSLENSLSRLGYLELYNESCQLYSIGEFNKLQLAIGVYQRNTADKKDYVIDERMVLLASEYYWDRKDTFNALSMCQQAVSINPFSLSAHLLSGSVYLEMGMYEQARFEFDTAINVDPTSFLAFHLRGRCMELQGEKEASEKSYRQASELYISSDGKNSACFPHHERRWNELSAAILDN